MSLLDDLKRMRRGKRVMVLSPKMQSNLERLNKTKHWQYKEYGKSKMDIVNIELAVTYTYPEGTSMEFTTPIDKFMEECEPVKPVVKVPPGVIHHFTNNYQYDLSILTKKDKIKGSFNINDIMWWDGFGKAEIRYISKITQGTEEIFYDLADKHGKTMNSRSTYTDIIKGYSFTNPDAEKDEKLPGDQFPIGQLLWYTHQNTSSKRYISKISMLGGEVVYEISDETGGVMATNNPHDKILVRYSLEEPIKLNTIKEIWLYLSNLYSKDVKDLTGVEVGLLHSNECDHVGICKVVDRLRYKRWISKDSRYTIMDEIDEDLKYIDGGYLYAREKEDRESRALYCALKAANLK